MGEETVVPGVAHRVVPAVLRLAFALVVDGDAGHGREAVIGVGEAVAPADRVPDLRAGPGSRFAEAGTVTIARVFCTVIGLAAVPVHGAGNFTSEDQGQRGGEDQGHHHEAAE